MFEQELLDRALVVWIDWAPTGVPKMWDDRVLEAFGPEVGPEILANLRRLYSDFVSSDAERDELTTQAIVARASAEFVGRHPWVSEDALRRLGSVYGWAIR